MRRDIPTAVRVIMSVAVLAIASPAMASKALLSASAEQKNYVRKARAQLNHLSVELHKAENHLRRVESTERKECEETLKHLWQKERLARIQLQRIEKTTPARWHAWRKDEDVLLVRLQKSYQHLINRYFK